MESDPDDVLVWADGAWLFRRDLAAMEDLNEARWRESFMVLAVGCDEWFALTGAGVDALVAGVNAPVAKPRRVYVPLWAGPWWVRVWWRCRFWLDRHGLFELPF